MEMPKLIQDTLVKNVWGRNSVSDHALITVARLYWPDYKKTEKEKQRSH